MIPQNLYIDHPRNFSDSILFRIELFSLSTSNKLIDRKIK